MMNDLPPGLDHEETERNAYNAAFYELGLHWHWDSDTYAALLRHSELPDVRLHHYLETEQAHLLKAYDADFLIAAIHERKQQYKPCARGPFDWAQAATWWQLGT
jgi:hypothetical protein